MYYGKAKVTVNGCKVNKAEMAFCIYPGAFTAIMVELIKHVCHRLWEGGGYSRQVHEINGRQNGA